jgi:hypothetical protein
MDAASVFVLVLVGQFMIGSVLALCGWFWFGLALIVLAPALFLYVAVGLKY